MKEELLSFGVTIISAIHGYEDVADYNYKQVKSNCARKPFLPLKYRFYKNGGHVIILIKNSCPKSTSDKISSSI